MSENHILKIKLQKPMGHAMLHRQWNSWTLDIEVSLSAMYAHIWKRAICIYSLWMKTSKGHVAHSSLWTTLFFLQPTNCCLDSILRMAIYRSSFSLASRGMCSLKTRVRKIWQLHLNRWVTWTSHWWHMQDNLKLKKNSKNQNFIRKNGRVFRTQK